MEEELLKRIEELERKIAYLRENEIVKLTAPSTAGSPSTNGYITVNVNGKIYRLMTTA